MREGKHAAKGGTMKVLIVLEGLLFTEDRGRFGSVNEHIYIYVLSDVFWMDRGPKEGALTLLCQWRGENVFPPFFPDVGNIPLLFTTLCILFRLLLTVKKSVFIFP